MIRIAECRDIPKDAPRAKPALMHKGSMRVGYTERTRPLELVHIAEGWACAGSMMRWDSECYCVRWEMDGAQHGRRFRSKADALALFNKWNAEV